MVAQTLRDYQERGVQQILGAWKGGARSVLAILPTGGGKTSAFCFIVAQLAAAGQRSLILVHRRELATQACNRLREFNVEFGLIMSGEPSNPCAPVQVASVQTLVRRKCPRAGLVICDEAHLSTAETWRQVLEQYPQARILGVTATPWRLSGKPLAGAYDRAVVISTPHELRERGYLCPYVGFSYKTPDLDGVKTTAGEYNEQQSAAAMSSSLIIDNAVEEWAKHARDLSTVVFNVTVEHSLAVTARFKAAGVRAEHLDGATPLEQRKAILRRVERGETQVLCNVGVAVEGLDIPRLKCCILNRPTKSLSRAIQMMGRVRRPWNGVTARIHDHAFVIRQHGLPDAERDYALDAGPDAKAKALEAVVQCPKCFALYEGATCPECKAKAEPKDRILNMLKDAEQWGFKSGDVALPEPEVQRPPVEVKWNDPGRVVEGVYQQCTEEQTQWGVQKRYLVKGAKRDYSLAGTVHLNALMSRVKAGDRVRITYLSETPLGGGKVRKEFRLEVDDGKDDEPAPVSGRKTFRAPAWLKLVRIPGGKKNGVQGKKSKGAGRGKRPARGSHKDVPH